MVSSFYNITEFFNRISLAHPNITTFTFGNLDDIDLAKQTQFPLAHLIINNVEVASGKITYDVSYMVMDKVANITPESTGMNNELVKDYIGVDNSIDVWNSSLETINNIYSYIQRNPDNLDYDIDGDAVLTPFKDRFDNLLAGWGADFSITVGNENNICVLDPMSLEYVLPAIDMARVSVSASYAQSASYADTASYFSGSIEEALRSISSSYSLSSSFSLTASYVALPATYSQAFTASYVLNAVSSSYVNGNSISSSFSLTASYWSGSIISASFALRTDTASYALHAGNSMSASWASSSVSSSLAETASYFAGAVPLPDNLLTTGSLSTSQSLNGGLVVSGSIIVTGSGQGGIQTHTLQLNGAVGNVINYRGTNNSTGNTSSLLLGTGASGFTYVNINNNGTASSEIRSINTQAFLAYTFSGSSNIIRANSTGVEVLGRSFSTTIPVTASSIRATAGFTGSLDGTASYAVSSSQAISSSYASSSLSASYAVTTSYAYDMEIANKLVVKGVLSASIFYADSASIVFTSGSNNFGNAITDLQILSGSVIITGSLSTTSPAYLSNITGSLYGTASQALTASYVDLPATYSQAYTASYSHTASYVALPATYSQAYTSSYSHTASYVELPATYSQAFTASYIQNAQFATSSLTASYALTASYISGSAGVGFPFTGSAVISGTLYVSNSSQGANIFATASNSVSSSYTLTASLLADTASQAYTSSYVINAQFATASLSSSYASSSLSSSYASSSLSSSYASSSLSASYVSSSQFINATSSANLVSNITDTYTGTTAITNIITLTQAEYDAIGTKSSSTVYYII